jgi:hypothetical protein
VLPRHDDTALLALYLGITAVSAILYELVEEPARHLILRTAGLERSAPRATAPTLARLGAAAALAVSMASQAATWAVASVSESLGPVTLAELREAGVKGRDLLTAPVETLSTGRHGLLVVGLPRAWREGWGDDLHAPSRLRVFADGAALPFFRREPAHGGEAAFFRRPRAAMLSVRPSGTPAEIVIARESPAVAVAVHIARLLRSPLEVLAVAGLFAGVLALGAIALRGRSPSPRIAVAAALGSLVWWRALELHDRPWGPLLLAAECVIIMVMALRAAAPSHDAAAFKRLDPAPSQK